MGVGFGSYIFPSFGISFPLVHGWRSAAIKVEEWYSFFLCCFVGTLPSLFPLGRVFRVWWHHGEYHFFVWMATWGKILTCNNLRRRWYTIVDWCCMYWCSGEGVDYLFIYRIEAYQLWSFVFRSFGISWVLLERVVDRLFGWWNWVDKYSSRLRNLVSSCLMWIILLERNRRTIEDLEKTRSIS